MTSLAFAEPNTKCSSGGSYYISDGVVTRPTFAPLIQCSGEVVLDSSVIQIGPSAFRGLYRVTKITLPESLTTISSYAFAGARSLRSISIPKSVLSIGTNVFSGTDLLQSIVVAQENSNYSTLNGALFNKSQTLLIAYPAGNSQKSFTIPGTVTTISSSAFLGAKNLTSVTIPSSVTSIGDNAFLGASGLTSINIPASVTSIGSDVFGGTTSLAEITVENGNQNYTTLDGALFNKSKTLFLAFPVKSSQTSFALPDSIVRIEASMFKSAKNLVSVTLGKSLQYIGDYAFEGASSLTRLSIPSSVTSIGNRAFYSASALTVIEVDASNQFYCSIEGILFSKEKQNLVSYPSSHPAKSFSIPSSVTEITESFFSDLKNLESISIEPGSATFVIENGALLGEERTQIIFYLRNSTNSKYIVPSTVKNVLAGAFSNAKNLTAFEVESTNTNFSVQDGVLLDKNGEFLIAYPSANMSSTYIIPSTITDIEMGAFTYSQFKTLVISDEADRSMLLDSGLAPTVRVVTSSQYAGEVRAAQDLKAKQEAEAAKAATELKAKQEAEAAAAKAAGLKKTTITCVKGKLSKKVTAIKPKCPKGYKKKN